MCIVLWYNLTLWYTHIQTFWHNYTHKCLITHTTLIPTPVTYTYTNTWDTCIPSYNVIWYDLFLLQTHLQTFWHNYTHKCLITHTTLIPTPVTYTYTNTWHTCIPSYNVIWYDLFLLQTHLQTFWHTYTQTSYNPSTPIPVPVTCTYTDLLTYLYIKILLLSLHITSYDIVAHTT